MHITEQWVGQAAGGRVFKEARAMLRLGKVMEVSRKDAEQGVVFQGRLASGARPMRVVVKVMDPTRVKNLCSCNMARSTGAMCEHAAAVILAAIQQAEESVEVDADAAREDAGQPTGKVQHDVVALEVRISPRFPDEGLGAIHLRLAQDSEGAQQRQADDDLAAWLSENVGSPGAAMLSLPKEKLAGFYRAMSGHSRASSGDREISVQVGRLRPPLELELEGEMMWLKLAQCGEQETEDLERNQLLMLGDALAEWNSSTGCLSVAAPVVENGALDGVIDPGDLVAGDWLQIEASEFVKVLDSLAEIFQLPEDLGGLDIHEAEPGIELEIAGSTRALQAQLVAVYTESDRVALATARPPQSSFPVASGEPGQWLVRNPEREQAAVARLMECGFQVLDASGSLFLRGEDDVIDFLTGVLPRLRDQWVVNTEEKLVRVEDKLERIVPRIELGGGGNDWLACDVSWEVDGRSLDRDVVRKLIQSGSRTVPLPRGGKAVISHFDAEVMEGFLLDTDPRQEDGRFYFPAAQGAYIERLGAYYGGKEDREEEPVPDLTEGLEAVLRGYQREGVEWLYRRALNGGAALLADDMGLGKTLQALAFIVLWKTHAPQAARGPALVVCPATLLGNWRDEAAKFVPDLHVLVMHGARRKDYYDVMGAADIIITSYALLDRDTAHYQELQPGALVLDEASAIRNPDTLVAKAARKLRAAAPDAACVAITGTPVENSVRDLWSIFQFMMPGYLGGREDFRRRYEIPCAAEQPDRVAAQRLRWRTEPFMLRRTKSLVAKDLPPKIETVLWCDLSPSQREHYQAILRHGTEKVELVREKSGKEGARMQMLTVLLRLRQSCCDLRLLDDKLAGKAGGKLSGKELADVSVKLARLMELLDEARRGGHRVLVFSQFTSMLALIRNELDAVDMDYCYLDGATRNRSEVVDRFQKPKGPPVFLISLKAGGYGLTLTAADTVVLFDPWWNPAVEAQAADRIHRIGQTKPATIYKLITRGTVEEKILRLQERKRSIITAAMGEVGDEASPMMSGLSEGEMFELLEDG